MYLYLRIHLSIQLSIYLSIYLPHLSNHRPGAEAIIEMEFPKLGPLSPPAPGSQANEK